jgi:hypothetical protein
LARADGFGAWRALDSGTLRNLGRSAMVMITVTGERVRRTARHFHDTVSQGGRAAHGASVVLPPAEGGEAAQTTVSLCLLKTPKGRERLEIFAT